MGLIIRQCIDVILSQVNSVVIQICEHVHNYADVVLINKITHTVYYMDDILLQTTQTFTLNPTPTHVTMLRRCGTTKATMIV